MKRVYIGIFLISLSSLLLQVTLTRIISVMLWYHFTYLVISVALLGYGAAGSHLAVSRRFKDKNLPLSEYAIFFAIASLVCPLFAGWLRPPHDIHQVLLGKPYYWLNFSIYYLLLFIPFYFAGMVIFRIWIQYSL